MVFLLLVSVLFRGPLTVFKLVGGEDLKCCQVTHNQLMSPQGPHFSPHSTAITVKKSRKLVSSGISDIAFASV